MPSSSALPQCPTPNLFHIAGGSFAGLFTAILLQADGHDVRTCERLSSGLTGRGAGLVPQTEGFHVPREIGCSTVLAGEEVLRASSILRGKSWTG